MDKTPSAPATTTTVIDTDESVRRNAEFATGGSFAGLTIRPGGNLRVIGCVDPRVDPGTVLGLKLGEAAVIRNAGGRVTPAILRAMAMLGKVGQANGDGSPPGDLHLVVLHHTDCGMAELAGFPDALAEFFEIPVSGLDAKVVTDPVASVRVDVDVVKQRRPAGVSVSGLVYDVATGLIEIVVPY
ncbi:MAG: carbonic anhydrase [Trebonia sp.]